MRIIYDNDIIIIFPKLKWYVASRHMYIVFFFFLFGQANLINGLPVVTQLS